MMRHAIVASLVTACLGAAYTPAGPAGDGKVMNPGNLTTGELVALDTAFKEIEEQAEQLQVYAHTGGDMAAIQKLAKEHVGQTVTYRSTFIDFWLYDAAPPTDPTDPGEPTDPTDPGTDPGDPSAGAAWPVDYSFDDGTLACSLPAGLALHELGGGYYKPDGGYVDLQSHVANFVDGKVYSAQLADLFIRGKPLAEILVPAVAATPTSPGKAAYTIPAMLADFRWGWRCYEVDGMAVRGCVFYQSGKWKHGAHEGHSIYANAFGDLTVEDCVFYEGGAQALQVDWRGGCTAEMEPSWWPETKITAPAEYLAPSGFLGRGLPTKTIAVRRCAVIECGKIRAGAPFPVEVERDSWDFTLYGTGQMVLIEDVYMRELEGTKITKSDGSVYYSTVGILHQDVRRCYPRSAPWVKVLRFKAEGRVNDRPMIQVGNAEDVLIDEPDLHDLGFDVTDPADDRIPTIVLESSVPHAVVEDVLAPVYVELRPWTDPHRSTSERVLLQPGDRWEGSPASGKL